MPKKIILVRHGETDYNKAHRIQGWLDIPLNSRGREQAREVAQQLKTAGIDVIYSSDLLRAKETAEHIAKELSLPMTTSRAIREHKLGVFEGWSWESEGDERSKLWNELMESMRDPKKSSWTGHKGESIGKFRGRVRKFLTHVEKKHPNETVAIVVHGGTILRFLEVTKLIPYGGRETAKNTEVISFTKVGEVYSFVDSS